MPRDVDRRRRAVGRHDEDVLIEVDVRLVEDDPVRVVAPAELDAAIPAGAEQAFLAGRQIENHEVAEATNERDTHAVG